MRRDTRDSRRQSHEERDELTTTTTTTATEVREIFVTLSGEREINQIRHRFKESQAQQPTGLRRAPQESFGIKRRSQSQEEPVETHGILTLATHRGGRPDGQFPPRAESSRLPGEGGVEREPPQSGPHVLARQPKPRLFYARFKTTWGTTSPGRNRHSVAWLARGFKSTFW